MNVEQQLTEQQKQAITSEMAKNFQIQNRIAFWQEYNLVANGVIKTILTYALLVLIGKYL